MSAAPPEITVLLRAWSQGDRTALDQLVPVVYAELGRIAERHLQGRHGRDTLAPTALVHEAYLRLCRAASIDWNDRAHFFAVSAQLMRRILVDHARARAAEKRGGGMAITLDEHLEVSQPAAPDLLDIDTALNELALLDEQQARVVELRFFAGLSVEETADALHISPATVKRDWAVARAWIRRRLKQDGAAS